jgi:YggT family protein
MGLLISFNVISLSNQYVEAIYKSVNALIDPLTRPIRKFMPDTGMIDFSPMVLIIGLQILLIILGNLEVSMR